MEQLVPDLIIALFADYDCVGLLIVNRGFHFILTPVAQTRNLLIFKPFLRQAFYQGVRDLITEFSSIDNLVKSQNYPKRLKVVLYVINLEHEHTKSRPIHFYLFNGHLVCFQRRNTKGQIVTETHYSRNIDGPRTISKKVEYFSSGSPSRVLDYEKGAEYAYRRNGTMRFKRFTTDITFYYDSKGTETATRKTNHWSYIRAPRCIRNRRALLDPAVQRPEAQADDTP
jgi:hypothetical protein